MNEGTMKDTRVKDVQEFFEQVATDWDTKRLAYYDERGRVHLRAGGRDRPSGAYPQEFNGLVAGPDPLTL